MKKAKETKEERYGDRVTAQGLLTYAKKFYSAFKKIIDASGGTADYYPAEYFLALHSIELSFKSVLRKKGYSLNELSSKEFGHNLKRLKEEIVKKNLLDLTEKEIKIINMLSQYYLNKQFEYFVRGVKELPSDLDLDHVSINILDKAEKTISNS